MSLEEGQEHHNLEEGEEHGGIDRKVPSEHLEERLVRLHRSGDAPALCRQPRDGDLVQE